MVHSVRTPKLLQIAELVRKEPVQRLSKSRGGTVLLHLVEPAIGVKAGLQDERIRWSSLCAWISEHNRDDVNQVPSVNLLHALHSRRPVYGHRASSLGAFTLISSLRQIGRAHV